MNFIKENTVFVVIVIITVLCGISAFFLLLNAIKEGKKKIIPEEDEAIFSEFEDDKFSPQQLETDKTLKILSLRNKLNKIEKQRSQTKK